MTTPNELFKKLNDIEEETRLLFEELQNTASVDFSAEFNLKSEAFTDELVNELEEKDLLGELETVEVLGFSDLFNAYLLGVRDGIVYIIPHENRIVTPVDYTDFIHPYDKISLVSKMYSEQNKSNKVKP